MQIEQGQTKTIKLNALSTRQGQYFNYLFYIDGIQIQSFMNTTENIKQFTHTFNESIGTHTLRLEVISSCPGSVVSTFEDTVEIVTPGTLPPVNKCLPNIDFIISG